MNRLEFEAKNLEEAIAFAEEEFRVNRKHIQVNVLEEKKGFFSSGSIRVEAIFDIDLKKEVYDYLSSVLEALGVEFSIDISEDDYAILFKIETDHNPLLIGKDGKTLRAFQFLVKHLSYIYNQEHINLSVDIGGYKDTRILQLEILATKTAKEVAKTKIPATLNPMNSYERRIVHAKLAEWRDVITESSGEEPNRCLVIKPRDK